MSKSDRIIIRIEPELAERIRAAAESDDRSVSSWIRQACESVLRQTS